MKKNIVIVILLLGSLITLAQETPGEQLSRRIAKRIADTLLLSNQQENAIFQVNKNLYNQKKVVFASNSDTESKAFQIQTIENKRDSLYKTILSLPQYNLYLSKKRMLVRN